MSLKRMLSVIAVVAVPVLSACGSADDAPLDGATSVVDPATGEIVATNFPKDARFLDVATAAVVQPPIDTCRIDDPDCVGTCSPIRDYGCEPCDSTNPLHWCYVPPPPPPPCTAADGLISQYREQRTGLESTQNYEVQIFEGSRCNRWVVTGIGASIVSDSNYEQLVIEYRELYANGTMGPRMLYRTGSNPYRTPEAWVQATDGYALVGVAAGQQGTHDLRTLVGYARQVVVTSSGVRMSGSYQYLYGGINPYGTIDNQAYNTTPNDNEVFIGLGLRSAVQQTKTLISFIGTLP
ncbi:hypothetical protein JY651_49155 [Pyxidicoccus parkwayensis]|uniref:Lipoprotein n=1 Tax=Pyxidicoccus parkwayensis TaxID=2813578 RepID=A0ABX7NVT3_9BACT|nr:hypothetical protein [Pyxidicoccus parkwaysis]QSQ22979.1 hypothetical protein JY651_49155 [Pyxidicoccus parkwaysis]